MPELPEVETVVRMHRAKLLGRTVAGVEFRWSRQAQPSPAAVAERLVGASIADVRRRAKFIVFELRRDAAAAGYLLIHLKMSGRLEWGGEDTPEPRHARVMFELGRGDRLYFCDARKFGRVTFREEIAGLDSELGAEPLAEDFTAVRLAELLATRRQRLKPFLLDQRRIAGLGNIYTDEALFRARLHPLRSAHTLRAGEIRALHGAIRTVLREGIRNKGTSIDWIYPEGRMQDFLRVYGRTGLPCRVCGRAIRAIRVAQRGTHYCPSCQRAPRSAERTTPRTGA